MISQELLTFLDIEASGIHEDSYPIEIGWVDTEGNECSFLVKPIPEWTHWDLKAEQIHGIPRSQLLDQGITIHQACLALNEQLGTEDVYSDAAVYDGKWLKTLFNAARIQPTFTLRDIRELLDRLSTNQFTTFFKILKANPPPHRAVPDATRMADAINLLRKANSIVDSLSAHGIHSIHCISEPPFRPARSLKALLDCQTESINTLAFGINTSELECVKKSCRMLTTSALEDAQLVVVIGHECLKGSELFDHAEKHNGKVFNLDIADTLPLLDLSLIDDVLEQLSSQLKGLFRP